MTRLPRRARVLALALRGAPIIAGIAAGAAAVGALLQQDWMIATWAGIATIWAFLYAAHTCPTPPAPAPVERGVQHVHFIGGPEDGGQGIVATSGRDLEQAVLTIDETDYRITGVRLTCYTAEATR